MAKIKYAQGSRLTSKPPTAEPSHAGLVIGFIHPGQLSAYFVTSLVATLLVDREGPRRLVGMLQEWSSANVSAARNMIVANFLDGPGEWLLFIDADMAFEPGDVDAVLAAADPQSAPVVGGLCFGMANNSVFPTIYQIGTAADGTQRIMRGADYTRDALEPVVATGAAFLLIHRGVLEAVRDRAFNQTFPWFQETEDRGQPVGEDVTFCLRAGLCGFPIHVHTGARIGHHKSQILNEALFLNQQARGAAHDPSSPGRSAPSGAAGPSTDQEVPGGG